MRIFLLRINKTNLDREKGRRNIKKKKLEHILYLQPKTD